MRLLKSDRSSTGLRAASFPPEEEGHAHQEEGEEGKDRRRGEVVLNAERQRDQEGGEAEAEADGSGNIEALTLLADGHFLQRPVAPDGAEDADRHIDEEDPAPVCEREDQPAQDGAGHAAEGERHGVDAKRLAALIGRKDLREEGDAVHDHHGRAGALHHARKDELGGIAGEAAQRRADGEDHEAQVVHAHAAEHIGDAAEGQQKDRADEDVGHDDPDHLDQVCVQLDHHLWQAKDHDGAVDGGHQGADGGNAQDDPFIVNRPAEQSIF